MTRRRRVRERKQRNKMRRLVRWLSHGNISYEPYLKFAKQINCLFEQFMPTLQGIIDGCSELLNNLYTENPLMTNPVINNPAINNPIMNDRKGCHEQEWIHCDRQTDQQLEMVKRSIHVGRLDPDPGQCELEAGSVSWH